MKIWMLENSEQLLIMAKINKGIMKCNEILFEDNKHINESGN